MPSESALSRFVGRLSAHQLLVEQCLVNATDELRGLVPAVKRREGKQDQPLPPLGAVLAVDSTLFLSYSNPNRKVVSDPDARWGLKHSAKAKNGKKEWGFGYKMTCFPTPRTASPWPSSSLRPTRTTLLNCLLC